MANPAEPEAAPPKRKKLGLLLGLLVAIGLGGGGFYVAYSGLLFGGGAEHAEGAEGVTPLPDITFVPVDPVVVSLGEVEQNRHLRFRSQLEVAASHAAEVTLLLPRIVDVLNGYLRAVDVAQLEDPAALVRVRAQLLRRIQIVTGEGRVRDLLISEFVLN